MFFFVFCFVLSKTYKKVPTHLTHILSISYAFKAGQKVHTIFCLLRTPPPNNAFPVVWRKPVLSQMFKIHSFLHNCRIFNPKLLLEQNLSFLPKISDLTLLTCPVPLLDRIQYVLEDLLHMYFATKADSKGANVLQDLLLHDHCFRQSWLHVCRACPVSIV